MEIKYIAFDSLGIKSSCIFVKTKDVKICVDPGIASEVSSFPLPLKERIKLKYKYKRDIALACSEADVIIISHYHYDHYQPIKSWYKDKILLIKDWKNKINKSQRNRANNFLEKIKNVAKEIKVADNNEFKFGKTKIKFSEPLFHGTRDTPLGYILMISIKTPKFKLLHSSDVNGPIIPSYADLIIKEKPNLLILDGAPTYLLGYIHSYYNLCLAILNLERIIRSKKIEKIILDHHALRDYRYRDLYYLAFRTAEKYKIKLSSASEELGVKPKVLDGYEKFGETKWKTWSKLEENNLKQILRNAKKNNLLEEEELKMIKQEFKFLI
jgi:hypothetical protein